MAASVMHLTNDDLLVKCPRCERWPMAATSVSEFAPHRVLFTCGHCREQVSVQVTARARREGRDAA